MGSHLHDWLNLLLRLFHLVAGIAWIGSSFYFIWLDSQLAKPAPSKTDVEGELWMVHSGGFYLVERKRIGPGMVPPDLHWFKYEALFTWISGICLLAVVYYLTGGSYLIDPQVSSITPGQATLVGVGLLACAWLVYDAIWASALGDKRPGLATAICLALGVGVAYGLCHLLSGRAAYIHFGAMLGTLMVANVWMRILPAQQRMIDATQEGRQPDFTHSARAKRRSVHNSYMTFPVLFIMLSNHYPATYGNSLNWLVLLGVMATGGLVRHAMIAKSKTRHWALLPAAALLAAAFVQTAPRSSAAPSAAAANEPKVPFAQARAIVVQRCLPCHSAKPSDPTFGPTPGGANFDTPDGMAGLAHRIRFRAVESKTMPLGNKTGITEAERETLRAWIDQGASIQ